MVAKRKDPAAVALGRKGGKASGGKNLKAFMATLTPKQRSERARRAVRARWARWRKRKGARKAKR
jgi:hypothetical protein